MQSFHIINGINVYSPDNDIYITGLSSAQEASFNPELTIFLIDVSIAFQREAK